MNRLAIDDLLGGILSGWCESVADWAPPGQGSTHTCTTCPGSILAGVMDVTAWPHDVMHQLATSLDIAAEEIHAHLGEQPIDDCNYGSSRECVHRYVVDTVTAKLADLLDVLVECVEPRLADFTSREVERVLARVGS